ncbi:uncharacterized protein LOC144037344 [Vanacampus margaritifer]
MFSELSSVSQEQQGALSELFNRVSFMQNFLMMEAHSVTSCLYSAAALCASFLLTATQRSSRARLPLMVLVCMNFYLERKIYQYVITSDHPKHKHMDVVSVYADVLRWCMMVVAVFVLLWVCARYTDPSQQCLLVLQQLQDTQYRLQEALQRAATSWAPPKRAGGGGVRRIRPPKPPPTPPGPRRGSPPGYRGLPEVPGGPPERGGHNTNPAHSPGPRSAETRATDRTPGLGEGEEGGQGRGRGRGKETTGRAGGSGRAAERGGEEEEGRRGRRDREAEDGRGEVKRERKQGGGRGRGEGTTGHPGGPQAPTRVAGPRATDRAGAAPPRTPGRAPQHSTPHETQGTTKTQPPPSSQQRGRPAHAQPGGTAPVELVPWHAVNPNISP